MEHLYFICFLCMWGCVAGEYAYVTTDPTLDGQDECSLPPTVKFSVETGSESLTLNLVRNDHVHPDVPSYVINIRQHGKCKFIREKNSFAKTRASYQDPLYEAAVSVSCHLHPKKGVQLEMEGGMFVDGGKCRIVTSQTPDHAGCSNESLEGALFVEGVKYRIVPSQSPVSFFRRLFHPGEEKLYHLVRAQEVVPLDSGLDDDKLEEIVTSSLEEIRLPADHSIRVKRSDGQPQVINIDVMVLLEYSVIEVWQTREGSLPKAKEKAKEYFALVLNAANLRYQSIVSTDYKYNIRLVAFYISEESATSPWSEDIVVLIDGVKRLNSTALLSNLQQWVNTSGNLQRSYDHIMLFTSYDLITEDNGFRFNYTTGFAYIGSMCDTEGRSISVVEDRGGFQSVGTVAHELGHSLGARHDGRDNDCDPEDRYLMAPLSYNETEANKYNPWFFSNCSVSYFRNYTKEAMTDPKKTLCLTETLTAEGVPDVSSQMPGQYSKPDTQCQDQYGNSSYLCRGTGFQLNDILCRAMFCYQPMTKTCLLMTAARGTTCGNKAWCINGECVNSTDAPEADADCPHGDQPYVRTDQGDLTCRTVVSAQPGVCYQAGWSSTCCESCKQACDGPPDCLCRDSDAGCVEKDCGAYNDTDRAKCCYTCRNYTQTSTTLSTLTSSTSDTTTSDSTTPVTYPSTCTDVSTFNGVTCAAYLQDQGRQICYVDHVNRSCCEACRNKKITTTTENCEWGDLHPSSCYSIQFFPSGSICPQAVTKYCCQSCENLQKLEILPTPPNQPTSQANEITASVSIVVVLQISLLLSDSPS